MDFGFYPEPFDADYGDIRIETLVNFSAQAEAVRSSPSVEGDWIYAPPERSRDFFTHVVRVLPYSSRVFGLPKTHTLIHQKNDPERLRFLVWCFGFFVGMRMSESEAGFLDATPVRRGVSNDIMWSGNSLMIALGQADDFFTANAKNPKVQAIMRAAMHAYFISDIPKRLDYERFISLYTAIDGCYRALELIGGPPKGTVPHKERIAYICEQLGLPVPWWADRKNPVVARQRNDTIHEGLFFDEPWGFSIWGGTQSNDQKQLMLLLEFKKLTCRIVLALLGVQDRKYLESSVSDRQKHGIHLTAKP